LFDIRAHKAPGPDGFHAIFYQHFWETIGNNLIHLALSVLSGHDFPETLNDTFPALIPKVENPQMVSQLIPIELCNLAYKVVSKVVVNQIKPIPDKVVAPTQASFVLSRQIIDNILVAQEMLHIMRHKHGKIGFMALKIDLEKGV